MGVEGEENGRAGTCRFYSLQYSQIGCCDVGWGNRNDESITFSFLTTKNGDRGRNVERIGVSSDRCTDESTNELLRTKIDLS